MIKLVYDLLSTHGILRFDTLENDYIKFYRAKLPSRDMM